MATCSAFITFLFAYIITLIYVKEPNYKYIGYIMLTIVYIFSVLFAIQNQSIEQKGVAIVLFVIVFITLFSLIKILDAYSTQASKLKSFDLKLNKNYKTQLQTFETTFIIGNVALALGLLMGPPILYLGLFVPFVCIWFQLAASIQFSKIKND